MGKLKKIGVGFGIIIAIIFGLGIIAGIGLNSQEDSLKNPEISPIQIKSTSLSGIPYDDLMRNNEKYVNKIVHYEGKIIQVQNVFGDTYALRISLNKDSFYIDEVVWVNYAGPRVLEKDIVEFWGTVKGIKEYQAVLGNVLQIPEVDSLIIEVVKKQD